MSSYKALYRKYRPQTFSEVVGQEHIVRTLKNEISLGHVFHAYLFNGPRGTGKTSIARIFAKSVNCLNPHNGESCSECELCKSITDGSNPDIIEIDAASQTRVDNIREIIDRVPYLPTMSKYKVYIIDEVHMLSQNSFNALLKTLEEPPKHAIFILCTTEVEKVIPTIISRCQKFDFHLIDTVGIKERLKEVVKEENIAIEDEAITLISENAMGGMRDALSILDQVSSISIDSRITKEDVLEVTGMLGVETLNELAKFIALNDATEAINVMEKLLSLGKEVEKIVTSLITYFKDMLILKNTSKILDKVGYTKDEFNEVKNILNNQSLYRYIEILSESLKNIKLSLDKKLYLELAFIKMCDSSDIKKEVEVKPVFNKPTYDSSIKYDKPVFDKPVTLEVKEEEPQIKLEEKQVEEQPINWFKKEEESKEEETVKEEPVFNLFSNEDKKEEAKEEPVFNLFSNDETKEVKAEPEQFDLFSEKSEEREESATKVAEEPVVLEKEEVIDTDYDVHFVEDVLNKADKQFKEQLILDLKNKTRDLRGTSTYKFALLLEDSDIVASSKEKIIFSYNEIGHCNLLMKKENYDGIKGIFKDHLGLNMDFIAIPKTLWEGLSKDFIVKYKEGIDRGNIKLTKIPCPGLKAVRNSNERAEDKFSGIEELFGDKLTIK